MNWLIVPLCFVILYGLLLLINIDDDVSDNNSKLKKIRKQNKAIKSQLNEVMKLLEKDDKIGFKK